MTIRSFILLLTVTLAVISQSASGSIGSEEIRRNVSQFLTTHVAQIAKTHGDQVRVDYAISTIDARLAMNDCPLALVTELKSQNTIGRVNIRVSCTAQHRWSLYVPVDINLYKLVVTAVNPIAKGAILENELLEMREMNISKLTGTYFIDIDHVIGMQAKRPLRANIPVIATHLQQPLVIKRGDSVVMTAQSGNLVVKIPGIALTNGHKGEQISVRNSQSKRIVEGKASAPGQVIIMM